DGFFSAALHFHKTKSTGSACLTVGNEFYVCNLAVCCEQRFHVLLGGTPGQVSDINVLRHDALVSCKKTEKSRLSLPSDLSRLWAKTLPVSSYHAPTEMVDTWLWKIRILKKRGKSLFK